MFAVSPALGEKDALVGWLAQLIFILVLPATKLSICLSYRHVFHGNKISRIVLTTVITILFGTSIALEFVSIFQCHPVNNFWTRVTGKPGKCIGTLPPFYVNGVSNLLTDIVLIAIVIPPILKLQMNRRQRIALLAVVSLGWLAVIAGSIRMGRTAHLYQPNVDAVWELYDVLIWTAVEVHVSLFCAAAPCIKPLVAKVAPKLLSSQALTSRKGGDTFQMSANRKSTMQGTNTASATRTIPGNEQGSSWMVLGGDEESIGEAANDRAGSKEGMIMKTEEVMVRSTTRAEQ